MRVMLSTVRRARASASSGVAGGDWVSDRGLSLAGAAALPAGGSASEFAPAAAVATVSAGGFGNCGAGAAAGVLGACLAAVVAGRAVGGAGVDFAATFVEVGGG